jgi:hypothetical protein
MVGLLGHRQPKGAANSDAGPNVTAPHLDSTARMCGAERQLISKPDIEVRAKADVTEKPVADRCDRARGGQPGDCLQRD